MNLPECLRIDGLIWEVDWGSNLPALMHGECDGDQCAIKIANRLTEQLKWQAFWHEILHALLETREVQIENLLHLPEEKVNEAVVRALAPALFTFLERNCEITWKEAK